MNFYIIFWAIVVVFSFFVFIWLSTKILYRGFPELLEMFAMIKKQIAERENGEKS